MNLHYNIVDIFFAVLLALGCHSLGVSFVNVIEKLKNFLLKKFRKDVKDE